jgi:hypothetical protein
MWSFLRGLLGKEPELPMPKSMPIDPTLGDPEAAHLRHAMRNRDWPVVRKILDGTTDPDELWFLAGVAAEMPGGEDWLPDIIRDEPDSTLPVLLYGYRAITWAWEARTGQLAQHVSSDRFKLFFQRIAIAEDSLQSVIQREPGNVTAHALTVVTAQAAQLGIAEAWERFNRAVALHPGHRGAHNLMLQQLCAKWGGSHADMHAFAEQAMTKAPPGSPLGSLVASAHLEHWLNVENMGYMRQPDVSASLRRAASRSILHPEYRRSRFWPGPHNEFALAFALAGENELAAEQFRIIGGKITESPWIYIDDDGTGDPSVGFCKIRARVLRAVSR